MGVPILTFSAASASMRRYISNRNLFHNHPHTHTSSTIRNLPRCDRTEQCPDKTFDTVQTKLLSSFWPSNEGRSVTLSAESHFACHALINACRSSQTLEIVRRQWSVKDGAFKCCLLCPLIDQSHVIRNPHQPHLNSILAQAPAQLFTFIHQRVKKILQIEKQNLSLLPRSGSSQTFSDCSFLNKRTASTSEPPLTRLAPN
jgi:hypothetical protein